MKEKETYYIYMEPEDGTASSCTALESPAWIF